MVQTRKDFIRMAEAIARIENDAIREEVTNTNVQVFKASNPTFDELRFRTFIARLRKKMKG